MTQPPVPPQPYDPRYGVPQGQPWAPQPNGSPAGMVSFKEAILRFFRRWKQLHGRATRAEYWWVFLATFGVSFLLSFFDGLLNALFFPDHNFMDTTLTGTPVSVTIDLITGLFSLALLVPSITLAVRRYHDVNLSGWWYLAVVGLTFVLTVAMVIAAIVGLSGLDTGTGELAAGAGAGLVVVLLCGFLLLLTAVTQLVVCVLPSNPKGARFDRQ